MAKSKYPNSIDTSIELPIVRDNIIQIGSEAINSLRSAIIQIEKTLGTEPNGVPSITVSERLNQSLDDLGNIKKEAINALNLISGPISNLDVSENASIDETKLNLDFSTTTLYAQILNLKSQVESFVETINDLSLKISIHLNQNAVNAHLAKNIGFESFDITESDLTAFELQNKNIQEILEQIINNHINYSGDSISSTNNSHSANQIYYDSLNSGLSANSVQEAIDSLSGQDSDVGQNVRDFYFNNGYQKTSKLGVVQNNGRVISTISITFASYNQNSDDGLTNISYTETLDENPEKFDLIKIDGSIYQIHSVDASLKVIKIFGNLTFSSITGQTGVLLKRTHDSASFAGLKLAPVFHTNLSFSKVLKVINPSSTFILSEDVFPQKIDTSNQTFTIEVDSLLSHTFSVNTITGNSIDTVINKINQDCSLNNLPISAFRFETEKGSRIGIAIDYINSDTKTYYIKLTSTNNSLDFLGFGNSKDLKIFGNFGSIYQINGSEFKNFSNKVISDEFIINSGTNTIDLTESDLDVLTLGVKENDLLQISNSSSNDGIYRVTSVSTALLEVDFASGQSFSSDTSTETIFKIQNNSVGFDDISYENLSTSGFESSVIQVFIDEDQKVGFNQIVEYRNSLTGSTPMFSVLEAPRYTSDKEYSFNLSLINPADKNEGFSIDFDGRETLVELPAGDISINLVGSDNKEFKVLFNISALLTKLDTSGNITSSIYTRKNINYKHVLCLGTVRYDDFRGLISGVDENFRPLSHLDKGFISYDEVAEEFVEEYIYKRFSETRSSGIIRGFEISNAALSPATTYQFDVESGVAYIGGKRFDISEKSFITNISPLSSDKIFIGIDSLGNVLCKEGVTLPSSVCVTPFGGKDQITLGSIEYDSSAGTFTIFDLRLDISDLDFKIFNDILVSPIKGMGHTTSISKALKIAKKFSQIFPNSGIPKVKLKAGVYKDSIIINDVSSNFLDTETNLELAKNGLYIDFPVIIEGEGEGTVLDLSQTYTDTISDSKLTNTSNRGILKITGNSATVLPAFPDATALSGNVLIKNLKLLNSKIVITDQLYESSTSNYSSTVTLENIFFEGTDTWDYSLWVNYAADIPATDKCGNINVLNCKFEDCGVYIDNVTLVNRIQNFEVSDCNFSRPNVSAPANDTAIFIEKDVTTTNIDDLTTERFFLGMESNSISDLSSLVEVPSGGLTSPVSFPKKGSSPGEYHFYKVVAKTVDAESLYLNGSLFGTMATTDFASRSMNNNFNGVNTFNDTTIFEGNTGFNGTINSISGLSLFLTESITQFHGEVDFYATVDVNANLNVNGTIDLTGDLDVSGDLDVGGEIKGSLLQSKSCKFRGGFANSHFLGSFNGGQLSRASSSSASVLTAYMDEGCMFVLPYTSTFKRIILKNHSTDSVSGNIEIYSLLLGASSAFANYTPVGTYPFTVAANGSGFVFISPSSQVLFSNGIILIMNVTSTLLSTLSIGAEIVYTYEI